MTFSLLSTFSYTPLLSSTTLLTSLLLASLAVPHAVAQPGTVDAHQKISATAGGFAGILDDNDSFGFSVAALGDVDGDGVDDLAVGAVGDADGGPSRGAVWVLFMNADGTVKGHQKISDTAGGFAGTLNDADLFGGSVTGLGDLDDDGVPDLAVGAYLDDDGGAFVNANVGAVWVLFLNANGTVKAHQKISATEGGFTGAIGDLDNFGRSVAGLGDLDGDGTPDLAVGAFFDGEVFANEGAVYVLFLNTDGTVKAHQKIGHTVGGFGGALSTGDQFGASVAALGDLDGDGIMDLAVGANRADDGGTGFNPDVGAVWVLFLNADGMVKAEQKISATAGGFAGTLDDGDLFGRSVAGLGDLDGDGTPDLAVGADLDDDGGADRGAVWVLFLNADGTVKGHQKISDTAGGFTGALDDDVSFGFSAAGLGDLDGDGVPDLAVGVVDDDGGGVRRGAVYVLFLDGVASPNLPPVVVSEPSAPLLAVAGSPLSFSVAFSPPESDQAFSSTNITLNGGITPADVSCSATLGGPGETITVDCSGSIATAGTYSVDIEATDDGAPPLSTTTTVAILVAEDVPAAIGLLAGDVASLGLPRGTETSLLVKLRQAQRKADEGRYHVAIVLLRAFISAVEDASGDTIAPDDADRLIAMALAIIAALEDEASAAGPGGSASTAAAPEALALPAAYPNPTSGRSMLLFGLPEAGPVRVAVYDLTGREVAVAFEGTHEAGWHEAVLDASHLASGMYLVRLSTDGGFVATQRLTVVR